MRLILIIIMLLTKFVFAQGEGALTFTNLQQSVLLNGAGQIGVSVPNDDVMGFYFNPAILGHSARINHASISLMPDKTEWFFTPDYTYHNFGLNLGYNLNNEYDLPIAVGLGYIHNKFSFGSHLIQNDHNPRSVKKVKPYDKFDCISLGIGIDYYLKFNFGLSFKTFESQLSEVHLQNVIQSYSADGVMWDLGALVTFPISDIFLQESIIKIDKNTSIIPQSNISVGYSVANVGDEIYYVDESQKDPLTRTERLGYNLNLGFDLKMNNSKLRLIDYSFTAEAENILVNPNNETSSWSYETILKDIDIAKNLIKLEGDNEIVVHKGHIFKFFDTLILSTGSYSGRGYSTSIRTEGIGFSTNGIFSLVNSLSKNKTINYIANHIVVEYFDTNMNLGGDNDINFDAISVHFRGFEI